MIYYSELPLKSSDIGKQVKNIIELEFPYQLFEFWSILYRFNERKINFLKFKDVSFANFTRHYNFVINYDHQAPR